MKKTKTIEIVDTAKVAFWAVMEEEAQVYVSYQYVKEDIDYYEGTVLEHAYLWRDQELAEDWAKDLSEMQWEGEDGSYGAKFVAVPVTANLTRQICIKKRE